MNVQIVQVLHDDCIMIVCYSEPYLVIIISKYSYDLTQLKNSILWLGMILFYEHID